MGEVSAQEGERDAMLRTGTYSAGTLTRPARPTFAAILEIGGLWWLVISVGVLLIAALLMRVYSAEVESIRQSRITIVTSELKASLEAMLIQDGHFVNDSHLRALVDDAFASVQDVYAIDVHDAGGVVLYSTDRGLIGDLWPPEVAQHAQRSEHKSKEWSVTVGQEAIVGTSIIDPGGKVSGYVTATYAAAPARFSWQIVRAHTGLGVATIAMLLVVALGAWIAARWALGPQIAWLQYEQQNRLHAALQRTALVRARMGACASKLDADETTS